MREATPPPTPTPVQPSAPRSLDKAISDGWSFCADNLAATSMTSFLMGIPGYLVAIFVDIRSGQSLGAACGMVGTMGIIRLVILSERDNLTPTVGACLKEGFGYWLRGVLGWIFMTACIALTALLSWLALLPGSSLLNSQFKPAGITYLVIAGGLSLWAIGYTFLRVSLTLALAAEPSLTSAMAFGAGLRATKGQVWELFWGFLQLGFLTAMLSFIWSLFYAAADIVLGNELPFAAAVIITIILHYPLFFLSSWVAATIGKAYLAIVPKNLGDHAKAVVSRSPANLH